MALATWSVQDPSLSHATDAPVRNLLGTPGAIAADLLMQLFGLASIALVLPVAVWGWRIATHRPLDREWMRLAFWLAGTVFAAGFASCLPKSAALAAADRARRRHRRRPAARCRRWSLGPLSSAAADHRRDRARRCCTLALIVVATGFGYRDPDSVDARRALGARSGRSRRTTTPSAPRSRSAGWSTRC